MSRQTCVHQKNYNGDIETFRDIPSSTQSIEAPSNIRQSSPEFVNEICNIRGQGESPNTFWWVSWDQLSCDTFEAMPGDVIDIFRITKSAVKQSVFESKV